MPPGLALDRVALGGVAFDRVALTTQGYRSALLALEANGNAAALRNASRLWNRRPASVVRATQHGRAVAALTAG